MGWEEFGVLLVVCLLLRQIKIRVFVVWCLHLVSITYVFVLLSGYTTYIIAWCCSFGVIQICVVILLFSVGL